MKAERMTEQEAAALVVEYLEEMGLDVYQEVTLGSQIADIVALRGPEIWIIEVKTTWSLDLLEQLREHHGLGHAHRLFAAVPAGKGGRSRSWLFKALGFGSIVVHKQDLRGYRETTQMLCMGPRVTSKPLPHIRMLLDEGHKTHAKAGAPSAKGRWTPFRRTCEALERIVSQQPGITAAEAVKQIQHHYSTDACARSSILTWASAGKVEGVKVVHHGRYFLLYPSGYEIPAPPARQDPLPGWAQPSREVAV